MYKLMKATAPTDLEKEEPFIVLTKEQKKEVRLLLKELFRYCTENRHKDYVSWKEMSLYNYVRGFWLFGSYQMREETFNLYRWNSELSWTSDKNVQRIRSELKLVMGDQYSLFFTKLNKEMIQRFQ